MTITGDNGDNLLEGDWGGQTILGLDGDDVIYGDPTAPPAAPYFLTDAIRDASAFDGAFATVSATVGGVTYVYGTSIEDGGLTAWNVDADGAFSELYSLTTFDYAGPIQIGGRALRVFEFDGVSYLLSSGLGLSLSAIGADGSLTHLDTIYDDSTLNIDRPGAVTAFEAGGLPYVVAAGYFGQGISVFLVDPIDGFVHVESHADAADTTLRLVPDLETVIVGGASFVIASGYFDSGVTVYAVGAGGVLTRTDHDTTELDLLDDRLDGAQTLATLAVGEAVFLYVGTEFGALSVYQISASGTLILLESHAGAYQDLQVAEINGSSWLVASTAGQDVAIYTISSTGRLTYDDTLTASGAGETGASGAFSTGGNFYLTVAQNDDDGFDLYQATIGGDDVIDAGSGDDEVHGGAGADTIDGGSGADRIWGDGGDDFIFGGSGLDVIRGGAGNDWLDGQGDDDELRGGAGEDTVLGGDGDDVVYGGSGADYVSGNNGLDTIFGGIGADILLGGPGADRLVGNNGLDVMSGGSGKDVLEGGPGADTLDGGGGADRLKGGTGKDILTGGAGADVFEFAPNSGKDRITDFDRAYDLIEIVGWTGGYGALTIFQSGAHVVVQYGSGEVVVENTTMAELDSGAFLFS